MVKIRRPKSNLILNTITPLPHSNRLHMQAHTHRWLCEVICTKQVFIYCRLLSVPWIPVSFLITVLFIFCSEFLESSLPKHLCGSLLLFSFFLAQTNQQSFPWACFGKHIYPIPLILCLLSLFIFKQDTYLTSCLLFLTCIPHYSVWSLRENVYFVHCCISKP